MKFIFPQNYNFKTKLLGFIDYTTLILNKTYLKLETNVVKPRFLEELQKNHSLFVCDFESMDYFWLDSLSLLQV